MYKAALEIFSKINDNGYEAYVVGGYVRDLYLNRHSIDVDICTNATPKQLKEIFGDIMLPNIQYGSVTIMYRKIRFEVTTYRKDIKYENNRIPVKIKYINSLVEDLKRRDFTINTLCMDKNGEIIDLLGAKIDLDNKLIKMVGNPRKRLKEDSLRILRAVRFATSLNFNLDAELKKYIKKYGYLLKKLSYYRKKEELEKMFTSPNAKYGITLLKELELDKHLELTNIDNLMITPSLIVIWSQLDAENIYGFSNHEKETIKKIKELKNKDILDNAILYQYGLYICSMVGELKGIPKKIITKKYNDLPIKNISDIKITGKEISLLLKKEPGAYLKDILRNIEKEILLGNLKNEYEDLKEYILNNQ